MNEQQFDYEYMEWRYSARGVFWRMGGSAQAAYEKLERQRWRVFAAYNDGLTLRRRVLKPKRESKP